MRVSSKAGVYALLAATLALPASRGYAKDLGDILLEKGVITKDELRQAREEEKQKPAETSKVGGVTIPEWINMITPFGDIRTRWEGFYEKDMNARNRFRVRARAGLKVKVSDELSGAIRLATGDADDPISTNQTLSNTFTRKSFNFDQGYITVAPGQTFNLRPGVFSVTAGKFGVNAYRTSELLWDDDLSPEGATETFSLVDSKDGFLRGLKLNTFQWVVDEISSANDPWMMGGQVVADTSFDDSAKWTVAFADFNYQSLNSVAKKFLEPTSKNYNSSLANSNTVIKDSSGKIIAYKSGFNIINASTELTFPDALPVPAGWFGDVAYNTQAEGRSVGFYTGVGIGKAGKDWYHDIVKKQGDWGVSYTYAWVEKNAVLSMFSYSDIDYNQAKASQKGSTNVSANILRADYVLLPHLTLTAKAELINALDRKISNASLSGNPTLLRTQLDAVLSF